MHLIVIAGPNGVGKSTSGPRLVRSLGFPDSDHEYIDFDVVISDLKSQGFTSSEAESRVEEVFVERVKDAISRKVPFAYESNLRVNPFKDILRFKQAGYKTSLCFMTLNSIEQSKARVNERVSKKGHYVPEIDIEYNFKQGLLNLEKSFFSKTYFDEILIFSNNTRLSVFVENGIIQMIHEIPEVLNGKWTKGLYKAIQKHIFEAPF